MSLRVFILAGEPSGDRLGGALMAGLKQLSPGVNSMASAAALMAEQGLVPRAFQWMSCRSWGWPRCCPSTAT